MVRAKMRVVRNSEWSNHGSPPGQVDGKEVHLQPVHSDGKVNDTWSKYTPCGELRLQITNPAAYEQFGIGKTFFVDFTEIDDKTELQVG